MKKIYLALTIFSLVGALPAAAVEKTAIDRRLNAPLDVDLQALQVFLSTLTTRIDVDLGNQITTLNANIDRFVTLMDNLEGRINALRTNYNACPHAEQNVPAASSYVTATHRLQWLNGSWSTQPTMSWEHD